MIEERVPHWDDVQTSPSSAQKKGIDTVEAAKHSNNSKKRSSNHKTTTPSHNNNDTAINNTKIKHEDNDKEKKVNEEAEQKGHDVFNAMNTDFNAIDMLQPIHSLSDRECSQLFKELDIDDDHSITKEDLKRAILLEAEELSKWLLPAKAAKVSSSSVHRKTTFY